MHTAENLRIVLSFISGESCRWLQQGDLTNHGQVCTDGVRLETVSPASICPSAAEQCVTDAVSPAQYQVRCYVGDNEQRWCLLVQR